MIQVLVKHIQEGQHYLRPLIQANDPPINYPTYTYTRHQSIVELINRSLQYECITSNILQPGWDCW